MNIKTYNRWIMVTSVAIPVVVVILFGVKIEDAPRLGFLPPIYAITNGLTAAILVWAWFAIKQKKMALHKRLMQVCMGLSLAFLAMYIAYHITSDPTPYGGDGFLKYLYYFILVTHIMLSVIVVPLALFSYARGLVGLYDRHRKIAKITFPVWLYVAISGVVVYLMIAPYYESV